MSFRQQVNATLDNVDGLTEEDRLHIQEKWEAYIPAGGAYLDTPAGYTEALANLQQIAIEHLLEKLGRLDELANLTK
jgi:hypothetical protein